MEPGVTNPMTNRTGKTNGTPMPFDDVRNLMRSNAPVGIVGYGAYVPRYRLPATEVARVWTGGLGGTPIKEKAVAGLDEDVITMSIEAARNALARAQIDPTQIRPLWVAPHTHPYAFKPPTPTLPPTTPH